MKPARVVLVAASCFSIVFISALSIAKAQSGIASVYSGSSTANGERVDANGMTANFFLLERWCRQPISAVVARWSSELISADKVVRGRVIDVTSAAARASRFLRSGTRNTATWLAAKARRQGCSMSGLGQKQTCAAQKVMSALPPKADMCSATPGGSTLC